MNTEAIEFIKEQIYRLRATKGDLLFDPLITDETFPSPYAEHLILARSMIEIAICHLQLAIYQPKENHETNHHMQDNRE